MKKVLIPLLVLSVLCLAVVPIFSTTTTASADELVSYQYGFIYMPAPSVFASVVWDSTNSTYLGSPDLPTLSTSMSSSYFDSSSNYSFLSWNQTNYLHFYNFGTRFISMPPVGLSVDISNVTKETVFYLITDSSSVSIRISDSNGSSPIAYTIPLNILSSSGIPTTNNSIGLNLASYDPTGESRPFYTPLYAVPITFNNLDVTDTISIFAFGSYSFKLLGVAWYKPSYNSSVSFNQGFQAGKEEGFELGKQAGISIGDQQGYDRGLEEGKEIGFQEGLVADEPLSAFQSLLVGANQALQTPLFGEGSGAFSIMDFVVIALGLGLLFWFLKMFAGG